MDEAYAGAARLAEAADPVRRLAETLDLAGSRWDAWVTSLATRQLARFRAQHGNGLVVGAYGWVDVREPLVAATRTSATVPYPGAPSDVGEDEDSFGYVQAPSLAQAVTAAVLRSGQHAHRANEGPLSIDLSSRRVRIAESLLEGVHQGRPLGLLLGYRFERALQEAGQAACIPLLRTFAPGAATDVVDGLALARRVQADGIPWVQLGSAVKDRSAVELAFEGLADALDAVADALLVEGVHQTLQGRSTRAGAALDAAARGELTVPELEFVRTPRRGRALTHRVLIAMAATGAGGWPATPRGAAEPALSAWVGSRLGNPAQIVALAGGKKVSVASLELGPLDLLALANRPAELEQYVALVSGAPLATATPAPGETSLFDVLELARALAALLAVARPLDGRDLVAAGREDPVDQACADELSGRVAAARTLLADAQRQLERPGADDRDKQLLALWRLGVPGTLPGADLEAQTEAALAEVRARQAKDTALAAAPDAPAEQRLAALRAQMRALLGEGFVTLARVKVADPQLIAGAVAATTTDDAPAGHTPAAWLTRMARVRPGVAALETVRACAELVHLGGALGAQPELEPAIAQLPPGSEVARWIGLPTVPDALGDATTSLAFIGPPPVADAQQTVAGLLVDEWTETIPEPKVTAGLSFHFDAPGARAPQTILLAVPPPDGSAWTLDALEASVLHAADLARARAADPAEIAPLLPFLPAVHVSGVGVEHLVGAPPITSLTLSAPLVAGGPAVQATVVGTGLAQATWSAPEPGITVSASSATVLTLRAAANVAPGPHAIQAKTDAGVVPGTVTVSGVTAISPTPTVFYQPAGRQQQVTPTTVKLTGFGLSGFTAARLMSGAAPAALATVTIGPARTDTALAVAVTVREAHLMGPRRPPGPVKTEFRDVALWLSSGGVDLKIPGFKLRVFVL